MDSTGYEKAVRRIVCRPSTISTIASIHLQEQHRILSSVPEELDFGELTLLMECEFEAALYYLPTALSYVEAMRQECSQVAFSSMMVIKSWQHRLNELGLYLATLDRIAEVVLTVTSQYQAVPDLEMPWASVVGGDERVGIFDAIYRYDMPGGDSTLFEALVNRWGQVSDCPQRSATFLDFFMQKDWSPVSHLKKVFSSPLVQTLRYDHELLRRHWALAGSEIERLCPPAYCEYLVGAILRSS